MGFGAASQRGLNGSVKTRSLSVAAGEPDSSGSYLIKPDSVDYSGVSAYISDSGQIVFNAVTSLSLNGCFGSEFDNYVFVLGGIPSTGAFTRIRMRSGGSDITAGTYTIQHMNVNGTSFTSGRDAAQTWLDAMYWQTTSQNNFVINAYSPYLAQPTAFRCITQDSENSARMYETSGTHSLSTSYDSISFFRSSGTMTGKLCIYGVQS